MAKDPSDLPETPFGARLKDAIISAGWTPTSFARAAGFPQGRLSKMYSQEKLRTDDLERVIDMTGVRTDWLLFGRGPKRETGGLPIIEDPCIRAMIRAQNFAGMTYEIFWAVRRDRLIDLEENVRLVAEGKAAPLPPWTEEEWIDAFEALRKERQSSSRHAKRERAVQRARKRIEEAKVAATLSSLDVIEPPPPRLLKAGKKKQRRTA